MSSYCRTDLASEAHVLHEREAALTEKRGVRAREESVGGYAVTQVDILDARGEQALGLPCGTYYTMKLDALPHRFSPDYSGAVSALAALIRRCLPAVRPDSVLVAALGNPDVTPDALGSLAAESVLVTRHLQQEDGFQSLCSSALCRPGVLGTSGMESALQIRSLCDSLHPGCVLVIDALAAADTASLCRCLQITNAGIAPGSGVGNNREALNAAFLGVPVAAIGVPTVIDAAFFSDLPSVSSLFVTPRDIDAAVRAFGKLIGYGVNSALNPGLSLEEMDFLLS